MEKEIIQMISNIEVRLNNIEEILRKQETSNNKLDDHIDFIDTLYEQVRQPVSKILTLFHYQQIEIDKKLLK